MNLIEQLKNSKIDSILDLGLSKVKHRKKFRAYVASHEFELTAHFSDISKETRFKRVMKKIKNKEKLLSSWKIGLN